VRLPLNNKVKGVAQPAQATEIWGIGGRAEIVIVLARHRLGEEEKEDRQSGASASRNHPYTDGFSKAEGRHGSFQTAHRLKQLADVGKTKLLPRMRCSKTSFRPPVFC
jgi:hypothetical protein